MGLNKVISRVGTAIVIVTVFLFAIFLIIDYSMVSCFGCFFADRIYHDDGRSA